MPFPQQTPKPFSKEAIVALNPNQIGCYGLFINQGGWTYVGRGDIRQRLIDHYNGDNPCITAQRPTHFVAVVTSDDEGEEKRLIRELNPHCNLRVG